MIKVGERLAQARKRKGFSVEEVAKATKIRIAFLQAIERGEYKTLPSSAYIQGFIRNYAQFLELPTKEILAIFRREFDEREFLGVLPKSFTNDTPPLPGFRLNRSVLLIIVALLCIVGFVFFQYRAAFFNPSLIVFRPSENATISAPSVVVIGQASQGANVTINDIPVFLDKDGNFRKDMSVFSGSNTIMIKASNSFGRTNFITRHITVQ